MPAPKNRFQILNLHLKKNVFKKKTFFNVLLPKYYQIFLKYVFKYLKILRVLRMRMISSK